MPALCVSSHVFLAIFAARECLYSWRQHGERCPGNVPERVGCFREGGPKRLIPVIDRKCTVSPKMYSHHFWWLAWHFRFLVHCEKVKPQENQHMQWSTDTPCQRLCKESSVSCREAFTQRMPMRASPVLIQPFALSYTFIIFHSQHTEVITENMKTISNMTRVCQKDISIQFLPSKFRCFLRPGCRDHGYWLRELRLRGGLRGRGLYPPVLSDVLRPLHRLPCDLCLGGSGS